MEQQKQPDKQKSDKQKIVIFNELNDVQVADEGDTILAFIINDHGLKSVASGKLNVELLKTIQMNLPKIMNRLTMDYKHKNGLK